MSGNFGPLPVSGGGSTNLASPVSIGNVTPNTITATDLTVRNRNIITPSNTQVITSTTSIAATSSLIPVSSTTPIVMSSNPQIATGVNGQKLTLINVGTNAITLISGNGLLMTSNVILYGGRQISFTYMSSYNSWVADVFVPENLSLTGIPTAPTAAYNANSTQVATTAQVFNHLYNHDVPGWRNLTLTTNWVDFGFGFPPPSVKRVGRDLIYVRGVVAVSGSYNTNITTIPVDCRPSHNLNFVGFNSTGIGQLTLSPAGLLTCATTLTAGQFQLITFSYAL